MLCFLQFFNKIKCLCNFKFIKIQKQYGLYTIKQTNCQKLKYLIQILKALHVLHVSAQNIHVYSHSFKVQKIYQYAILRTQHVTALYIHNWYTPYITCTVSCCLDTVSSYGIPRSYKACQVGVFLIMVFFYN